MMRSPYQSPKDPPAQRFLRLPPQPRGRRRKLLVLGAGLLFGFLAYSIVGTDTGLIRIRSLEHETRELARRKADLEARALQADKSARRPRDPRTGGLARERFHIQRTRSSIATTRARTREIGLTNEVFDKIRSRGGQPGSSSGYNPRSGFNSLLQPPAEPDAMSALFCSARDRRRCPAAPAFR
jgi:hypothetical protein